MLTLMFCTRSDVGIRIIRVTERSTSERHFNRTYDNFSRYYHGGCGTNLQHVLLQNEVLPPELGYILLDCAAGGAEVIESGHRAVDLKARHVEELPLEGVGLHRRSPIIDWATQSGDEVNRGIRFNT